MAWKYLRFHQSLHHLHHWKWICSASPCVSDEEKAVWDNCSVIYFLRHRFLESSCKTYSGVQGILNKLTVQCSFWRCTRLTSSQFMLLKIMHILKRCVWTWFIRSPLIRCIWATLYSDGVKELRVHFSHSP